MTWEWSLILKPIGLLILFLPGVFVVVLVRRIKDSKLKRFLLFSWRV